MTDRELLELAAMAACIEYERVTAIDWGGMLLPNGAIWNPIVRDDDALRLAVMLQMRVEVEGFTARAVTMRGDHEAYQTLDCPYAATRRAITRAAAEIGRAMTCSIP